MLIPTHVIARAFSGARPGTTFRRIGLQDNHYLIHEGPMGALTEQALEGIRMLETAWIGLTKPK